MATKDKLINLEDMKAVRDHDMAIVDNKANSAGSYPDLIAGTADNLLSSSYQADRTPYLLRRTPYGARERGNIVGGSIVWNQLENMTSGVSNGITYTKNDDGSITMSGTSTAISSKVIVQSSDLPPAGHKVLILRDKEGTYPTVQASGQNLNISYIHNMVENDYIRLRFVADYTVSLTIKVNVIDLTKMFGSTIADYIYTQEQASAGAGVAFFRSLFSADYYVYNAGTLMSVNTSAHKMVGFNQWDEEWENGYLSTSTGQNSGSSSTHYRSKNYIPVFPNGTYYFLSAKDIRVFMYRADKSYIDYKSALKNVTRTVAADCHYIRFDVPNGGNHEEGSICINISSSRNGQYEPYTAQTYPLDSTLTLRGLPKLDGDNLYYDGDIYKADGEVERRYGVVDLGTLNWTAGTDNVFYSTGLSTKKPGNWNILCSDYAVSTASSTSGMQDKECKGHGSNRYLYIRDTAYSSASDFKAAMSGVYLVYELAEPTTEQAEPYTALQICDPNGTEEWVGANMPVGHETQYYEDLKGKIEDIPDAPSADGTYTLRVTVSGGVATYSWG